MASFLGRGWGFPPTFSEGGRELLCVAGEEDIRQGLLILLSTAPGERVMQERFGCDLSRFLFETMDGSRRNEMADAIRTALLRYEPRIDVESVAVAPNLGEAGESAATIQVIYRIRATNSRFNLVAPFYREEGARLLGGS